MEESKWTLTKKLFPIDSFWDGKNQVFFFFSWESDSVYITHNPGQTSGTGIFGEHRRASTVWCCLFVCFVFKLEKSYKFEWIVMGEGSEKSWGTKNDIWSKCIVWTYKNKNYTNKRK